MVWLGYGWVAFSRYSNMGVKQVALGLGGQLCAWVGAALGLLPAVLHYSANGRRVAVLAWKLLRKLASEISYFNFHGISFKITENEGEKQVLWSLLYCGFRSC